MRTELSNYGGTIMVAWSIFGGITFFQHRLLERILEKKKSRAIAAAIMRVVAVITVLFFSWFMCHTFWDKNFILNFKFIGTLILLQGGHIVVSSFAFSKEFVTERTRNIASGCLVVIILITCFLAFLLRFVV